MLNMFSPWWEKLARQNPDLATPTYLFRSEEHEPWETDDLGWSHYCRNVTVIPVAASRESMLVRENFSFICAELARLLKGGSTESVNAVAVSELSTARWPKG